MLKCKELTDVMDEIVDMLKEKRTIISDKELKVCHSNLYFLISNHFILLK